MIPIAYSGLDGLDTTLQVDLSAHSTIDPTVDFALAHTGGEGSPVEISYKGRELFATFETKPLRSIDFWPSYKAFLEATEKRELFTVFAATLPLVDVDYVAFRADKKRGVKPLHHNRFFTLSMRVQIVRIET